MGWFGRKRDPLSEQERRLNARLHELQSQISSLHQQIDQEQAQPKLRSTAQPHATPVPGAATHDPAFEAVSHQRVTNPFSSEASPPRGSELGVKPSGPFAPLQRFWRQFRGTQTRNPTLVRYLAAGNVQGLRPLRYEKRVARNRFLMLLAAFIVILYGLIYWYRNFL